MKKHPLYKQLKAVIEEVQPILGLHGGSIELDDISADNVVSIRFVGACVGCVAADITLEYGLKEMIMLRIEEVSDVISVNNEPITHDAPRIPLTGLR